MPASHQGFLSSEPLSCDNDRELLFRKRLALSKLFESAAAIASSDSELLVRKIPATFNLFQFGAVIVPYGSGTF
jgi:hypothetical protein